MKMEHTKLFGLLFFIIISTSVIAIDIAPQLPDPCCLKSHDCPIDISTFYLAKIYPSPQSPVTVYGESKMLKKLPSKADLVVIVNGNSYYSYDYVNIAQ